MKLFQLAYVQDDQNLHGFTRIVSSNTGEQTRHNTLLSCLAIKRASSSPDHFMKGDALVDDIIVALIENGEEIPEEYIQVQSVHAERSDRRGKNNDGSIIVYRKKPAMGVCDLRFSAALLERYPSTVPCPMHVARFHDL